FTREDATPAARCADISCPKPHLATCRRAPTPLFPGWTEPNMQPDAPAPILAARFVTWQSAVAGCRLLLFACACATIAVPAQALDLSGGVSVGGVVAGLKPRFAVTPHAALGWRTESGFLLAVQELFSILPAVNLHGAGVYSHTTTELGYAWDR